MIDRNILLGKEGEKANNTRFVLKHPGIVYFSEMEQKVANTSTQIQGIAISIAANSALVAFNTVSLFSILMVGLTKVLQAFEFFALLALFSTKNPDPVTSLYQKIFDFANFEFMNNPLGKILPHSGKFLIEENLIELQVEPSLLRSSNIDLLVFVILEIFQWSFKRMKFVIVKKKISHKFFGIISKFTSTLYLSYFIDYWFSSVMNMVKINNINNKQIGDWISLALSAITQFLLLSVILRIYKKGQNISFGKISKKRIKNLNQEEPKEEKISIREIFSESAIYEDYFKDALSKEALASSYKKYYNLGCLIKYKTFVVFLIAFQSSPGPQIILALLFQFSFLIYVCGCQYKGILFENWYTLLQTLIKEIIQFSILGIISLTFLLNKASIFYPERARLVTVVSHVLVGAGVLNEIVFLVVEILIAIFIKIRKKPKRKIMDIKSEALEIEDFDKVGLKSRDVSNRSTRRINIGKINQICPIEHENSKRNFVVENVVRQSYTRKNGIKHRNYYSGKNLGSGMNNENFYFSKSNFSPNWRRERLFEKKGKKLVEGNRKFNFKDKESLKKDTKNFKFGIFDIYRGKSRLELENIRGGSSNKVIPRRNRAMSVWKKKIEYLEK